MSDTQNAAEHAPTKLARQVRRHLTSIEAALASGLTHEQVHAWLCQQGVKVSFKYYETILYRIRQKSKKNGAKVQLSARAGQVPAPASRLTTHPIAAPYNAQSNDSQAIPYDVCKPPRDW